MFGPGRVRKDLLKQVRSLTAVLNAGGRTYEKRLKSHFMHREFRDFRPTERQMNSRQWMRENGWRERCVVSARMGHGKGERA
jgi:hypothetical protein